MTVRLSPVAVPFSGTDASSEHDHLDDPFAEEEAEVEPDSRIPLVLPAAAPRWCAVCSAPLDGRSDQLTCEESCRKKRLRLIARFLPVVTLLARMIEGDVPGRDERPPPLWGLLRAMWLTQRALARNRVKARQLPGRR